MVRRNDDAVEATCVAGQVVFRRGRFAPGYGEATRTGQFLRAGTTQRSAPTPIPMTASTP